LLQPFLSTTSSPFVIVASSLRCSTTQQHRHSFRRAPKVTHYHLVTFTFLRQTPLTHSLTPSRAHSSYKANYGIRIPGPGSIIRAATHNQHTSATIDLWRVFAPNTSRRQAGATSSRNTITNKLNAHTQQERRTWQASATQPSGNAFPSPYTWTKTRSRSKDLNTRMSAFVYSIRGIDITNPNPYRDSWLARQQGKKKNRTIVCWCFWLFFLVFVAAIVGVIIWLVESGVLDNLGHHDDDGKGASSSS
jgi:hypothetical protein